LAYLDVATFKGLTTAPAVYIDQIEAQEAGWTLKQLDYWSRRIDGRLGKRYATPFSELAGETPLVVQGWLSDIVTLRVYKKRGVDPQDQQYLDIVDDAKEAWANIREAADAKDGLFELPLKQTAPGADGVTKGAPLGYAEASPYTWTTAQRDAAEDEGGA
jgi:hypothetical protein